MRQGFTLIELSIVLVILAVLGGMGLQASAYYIERNNVHTTREQMNIIRDALFAYRAEHKRFPCPARPVDSIGATGYGRESDCTAGIVSGSGIILKDGVRIGAVPFRDLNLPEQYGHDRWNQKFIYAITESLAIVSSFGSEKGIIGVYDGHGNSVSSPADEVAFVLVSTGPNRKGSYTARGGSIGTACAGSTIESENCNADSRFHDAPFNNGEASGAAYNDDLIVWGMKSSTSLTGSGNGYLSYVYRGLTSGKYKGNRLMKADQECKNHYGNTSRVLRSSMMSMVSIPDIAEEAWIYCDTPLGSPGCIEGGQYTNGLLIYSTYIDPVGEVNPLKATLGNFRAACADHEWMAQ